MKRLSIFFAALMACTLSFAQTDYSTTYTSNVTLTAGTNASAAKISIGGTEYDGIKAGTSKKAGTVTITVPANMTNLHIHAIAWNGVTGASVSITSGTEGATCTPAALTLANNAGITNNSPFTISGDMLEDYYFNVALTGITAETTLTLSCDKRFVVFGVNAVAAQAVEATAIALDKTTLELEQYKSAKLEATLTPAEATTIVAWTSSDEKIATVGSNGVVTAVGAGTADITATAGTVSAKCAVTVKEATPITCAEAVELAKAVSGNNVAAEGGKYVIRGYVTALKGTPADDMKKYSNYSVWMADTKDGGEVFLAFQVKPADGTTIAAVGDYVEVVGDITKYTDKDNNTTYETMGRGAATISVLTTTVAVESIALDKTELNIEIGKTATLVATITPEDATNKDITWATDNDQVATVADGVVTAVAEGKANITVTTADGGYTATCIVTVEAAAQVVDVTLYSVDFTKAAEAKTWTINDVVKDENLKSVWQQTTSYGMKASAYIKPTNYATESWLISPVIDFTRAKSATMTFNHARKFGSNDHLSVKATTDGSTWTTLNVSEWPDGSSWDFIEATADLTALLGSANAQIAFVYTSTTSGAATWEIKNMSVTGTEEYIPATGITLSTTALTMQQYKYISLIATVAPATTTDAVVWTSDNEEVAIVSEKGVVTTMATGTANITATAGTQSATCAITVIEASYITCAQAVEIAKTVSENNVAAEGGMYVIRGYVTKYNGTPSESMEQYKNYSAWLADTKGGEGTFIAYQVKPVDGTTVANIGDYVEVVGDITQYNGTYETMGRGTATIRVISSVSTDVDNVTLQSDDVVKTIHNGQVVILRNNKVYNTLGQEISK